MSTTNNDIIKKVSLLAVALAGAIGTYYYNQRQIKKVGKIPNEVYNDADCIKITAESPINIALVKYWGKLDKHLIIPTNSSLSITIDPASMCSRTTIRLVRPEIKDSGSISLRLNGKTSEVTQRIKNVVEKVKESVQKLIDEQKVEILDKTYWGKKLDCSDPKDAVTQLLTWGIHIESSNNFNTAAGLASSSSGLSCLGFALAKIYGLPKEVIDYSVLARLGSGSACRSIYGGFVKWNKGWDGNYRNINAIK